MEVALQENTNSAEDQAVFEDPKEFRFVWEIEKFSQLKVWKQYSPEFVAGGYKWRVMISPKCTRNSKFLSVYLEMADSSSLSFGWSCNAEFSLAVLDQIHNKCTREKKTICQFNQQDIEWGFSEFLSVGELSDRSKGYLVKDTVVIEAVVSLHKDTDSRACDSKKETAYVGLKNQGATCYLNSLLQTLFHIPYFRKAVYRMPTAEAGSMPLALVRLFYKLQCTQTSVGTEEFTKYFGWKTDEHQDIHELNRILCEKLEVTMRGTDVEGAIPNLFEGHLTHITECINVDYKSIAKEAFYDLQLDVKGCKDVYASFDKYVEIGRLEGENKYEAEGHGLQDAKKGVLFTDFPPVLELHLKRFEFDSKNPEMGKINDRYEFPLQLDLDRENGKYLSPDADRSVRNLYTLYGVLVHSGRVSFGHYYAFIRPSLSQQWYKFNDEIVTKEDMNQALEEQYGGQSIPGLTKSSNAYMLVYIRESVKDTLFCDVDENDIAEDLRIKFEEEEKGRHEAQAHLYTIIKVARDEDLREQIGRDIYFGLVDHDKTRSFRVQNRRTFNHFKEELAKEFGVPVQSQRFWLYSRNKNRPDWPITPQLEAQTVAQLREVSNMTHNAVLKLFLEVKYDVDLRPMPLSGISEEDILVFCKLYDPEKEELRYVGRCFVKSFEILGKLREMARFSTEEDIEIYAEIMFEPEVLCVRIDINSSFQSNWIEDGDIICFQKLLSPVREVQLRCPNFPSYLEYVKNRQVVHFRRLERPEEEDFCLELEKNHTYGEVVERVAEELRLDDPSIIRLTSHNGNTQILSGVLVHHNNQICDTQKLSDMLVDHNNQKSDILYYEVLDISEPESQALRTLEVTFLSATGEKTLVTVTLPKQRTVEDVLNSIKTKVELSQPDAELRLYKVLDHKVFKILGLDKKIETIDIHYSRLRAGEIRDKEKNLTTRDCLIRVCHFNKEARQHFGEPFFQVTHEGETLAEVKLRIQERLQVADEEFSKWKFGFRSLGRRLEDLEDTEVVFSRFQSIDVYNPMGLQQLVLQHSDTTP